MKPSESIKPISYVKAHASELIRDISNNRKTLVITQNGEAKAILQDIKVFEQTQESLALLKILAMSTKSLKEGRFKPLKKTFRDVKDKMNENLAP